MQDPRLALLVAIFTAACAGFALSSAIVSGDAPALAQFSATARYLFELGGLAVIGLLAHRVISR
jgi:hypothetical protein